MKKRYKVSPKKSKKQFRKTGTYVNPKNSMTTGPNMRGGIRI